MKPAILLLVLLSSTVYADSYYLSALHEAIYHEARGEPLSGQIAVGMVVMNRVKHRKFPNTIHEVLKQPKQFSYRKDVYVPPMKEVKEIRKTFVVAIAVLTNIYYNDKYANSLFYHACSGKHKVVPKWNWKKLKKDGKEGNHCFYSLK